MCELTDVSILGHKSDICESRRTLNKDGEMCVFSALRSQCTICQEINLKDL